MSAGLIMATTTGASNYLIEDVTINPTNPTPYLNGVNANQAGVIRRLNISRTVDGVMIFGNGVQVRDSFLHSFSHFAVDPNWGGGPSHDDAIQVQGGSDITIEGNNLSGAHNTAVMVSQDTSSIKNLKINKNWIDFGGCSINFGSRGDYKSGMQVNGNSFGRAQRVTGCAIIHNATKSDLVPIGNTWADNGQAVVINRGS